MAMAMTASDNHHASATITGVDAEDVDLYDQILRLRDDVLAGKHPSLRLSPSATAALAAALQRNLPESARVFDENVAKSSSSNSASRVPIPIRSSNPSAPSNSKPTDAHDGVALSAFAATAASNPKILNPIFLEKSDSLVRAEGQLKRQRIEREFQIQVEQRRQTWRDKDNGNDGTAVLDIDGILHEALTRIPHVSGLKPEEANPHEKSSSFDTNDYYSSQAPSDMSSEAEVVFQHPRPETVVDILADTSGASQQKLMLVSQDVPHLHRTGASPVIQPSLLNDSTMLFADTVEDDDDYVPPEASTFDLHVGGCNGQPDQRPPNLINSDADDESEYEPGEISQDSKRTTSSIERVERAMENVQTLPPLHKRPINMAALQPSQVSPPASVPIIRNRLNHFAAPQPSRVSPLATVKGPNVEVAPIQNKTVSTHGIPDELRSGLHGLSRPSSASPAANGTSSSNKKKRNKKRKREPVVAKTTKRQKNQDKSDPSLISPFQHEPRIKDEPRSPIPFSMWQNAIRAVTGDTSSDLASPAQFNRSSHATGHGPAPIAFAPETNLSTPPNLVPAPTPPPHRLHQRDTNNLRRFATLQHAQQPNLQQQNDPAAQRAIQSSLEYHPSRPLLTPAPDVVQNGRVHDSRPYDESQYQRRNPPEINPPGPAVGDSLVLVDQWGRRYYREPDYTTEYRPQPSVIYDQPPSQIRASLGPPLTTYQPSYARPESVLDQPRNENPWNAYTSRLRDIPTPVSQMVQPRELYHGYQSTQQQVMAPPLPVQTAFDQSYGQSNRAPSVFVEDRPSTRIDRQPSAAPVQYVRHEVPTSVRAISVAPQAQYSQQQYNIAPLQPQLQPATRYVDQYGQEVYPRELRQVGVPRY